MTISELYKKAHDRGVLKSGLTEEQFTNQISTDEGLRSFYNYATTKGGMKFHPYDDFKQRIGWNDTFGSVRQENAPSAIEAVVEQPTPTQEAHQAVSTMPVGAAADSTDAAITMLMQQKDKEQKSAKEERARINAAQLPMSDDDRTREEQIRNIDATLSKVGVERFGNRMPIGDEREDVLQQQKQLEQERATLQGQRKNYMAEPTTVEEARESWIDAWSENTEEGKQAKSDMEKAVFEAQSYLLEEFKKSDTFKSIYADVQGKVNRGELSVYAANKELNTRLEEAFVAENEELLNAEKNTQVQAYVQRALKADNGWLKRQEERLGEQALREALDENLDELNAAMKADYDAFAKSVGNGFGAAQAKSNYIEQQQLGVLGAAAQLLQETNTILSATKKGEEKVGSLSGEILRHTGDKLKSIATFGMSDTSSAMYQANVLKKIADANAYDNPESVLDRDELVLYDAIVANMAAQIVRAENTSHLANAGKLTAEMIPFVMEIAIGKGLFSGMTKAAQRGVSRSILRSLGNGKWRRVIASQTGELLSGALESAAIAAIAPSTYKQIFQNEAKIDPTSLQLKDGKWTVGEIDQQSTGSAIWNAYRGNWREMFTETGGLTQFAAGFLKVSPLGKLIQKTPIGKLSQIMDNNFVGKMFKQTAYHGIAGELSEEWENTFYEATEAFLKADKGKKWEAFGNVYGEFVKPETQVPMLISFSLPAIFGGAVTTGQMLAINSQYKKAYNNLRDTYMKYGATEEEFEDALNELVAAQLNVPIEQYPDVISAVATTLSGGNQEQANEFAAALSAYMVADANLGAIQEKHAKKQRQVQSMIHELEAAEQRIAQDTHTDGMMYHVEVGGKPGYFVRGILPLEQYEGDEFARGIGTEIVTVRMEDGNIKQVAANQVKLLEQPQTAENAIEFERRRLTAKMNNLDRFKVGYVIYITENGQPVDGSSSRVVDVTDEGVVTEVVLPNGTVDTTTIPHDVAESGLSTSDELVEEGAESAVIEMPGGTLVTMQKTATGDWMQVAPKTDNVSLISQREFDEMLADSGAKVLGGTILEQPSTDDVASGNGVVSEEAGEMAAPIEQPAEQPIGQPASKYPTTQEGKLDWVQMDAPTATAAALEKFGDKETAKEYAEVQIAQAKKAVAAANKKKATSTDADEFVAQKNAIKQEQEAAQAELSKWENVVLAIANYKTEAEQAEADAAAQRAAEQRAQRKQTIEGVGGGSMAERLAASPRMDGNTGSITAADGTKIPGHYVLVSANALTPSHNPNANFALSEGYPMVDGQSINDRDYQADQEEQAKVQQVAQTYDGRAITNMPIVSDEGLVYSGNGRTMAGQLAAANGTDGAYIEALKENATQFGFTAEQVDEVPNARVVFMTDERLPYNTSTLALFNMTEQQTQSNTAAAAANVRKLTPEAVGHIIAAVQEFDNLDAFFTNNKAPFELVNQLIADGIISERDKAAFVDNGLLTATGKDRLTALLFGTAFDEKTIRLLGSNAKVRNSVMRALPQILENKGLGDFSLFEHINNAIQAIYDMDTNKMSFFEFTRQIDIEGKTASDKYSAFELLLVDEMVNGGVQSFRDVLNSYNTRAKESAGGQMDLFTGETLTTEVLTTQILEQYEQRETNERRGAQPESAVAGAQEGDGETIEQAVSSSVQKTAEEQQKNASKRKKSAESGEKTQTDTKKAQEDEQKSVSAEQNSASTEQKSVEQNKKTQEVGEISETVDELDAKLAAAEAETDTNPTEAQKKAENYKQGHVTLWGLPFTIENPKGSVRRGTDANGKQWKQVMNNTYGKIRRTEGVDGDHIDVFFGPNLHSEKVFVVDQRNVDTGEFDEHKVMLGFDSMQEAQYAYLSNYEEGWQGMGPVTETTMDEFKKWIESSHRKTKPFSEYKSVKKEGGESAPDTNVASKEGAVSESELQNLAQTLGAKGLHIVSSKEELPKEEKAAYRAIQNGVKVTGWYNPKTNQAYIYAPNVNNTREMYLTLLHELVAHKGLRDMLGKENFDKLCHDVWNMMSEQDKLAYAVYVKQQVNVNSDKMQEIIAAMTEEQKAQLLNDTNVQLEAADEYMAHFAETGVSEQERSIWQRIVDAVKDLLRKIGINIPLSDADIARMLYESNRRFSSNMTMKEVAQRIAKNNGVYENLSANAKNMGLSDNVRFRISEEQDKAYAAAVELGDIAAAEEMLRKAAEEAGYLPQSDYQDAHGAPRASVYKEDFTNAEAMQEAADNGEDTNLWAVAQGISIQPDDYFSPQGPRWYGYSNQSGMESYAALSSAIRSINSQINEYGEVKDMPKVMTYRAVPTNIVGEQLESEGQWVTPSLEYAIRHGENRFDGNYRIIEQEVPADQLWWDGMDPREWGFDDGTNNVYQNTKNNRKLFEVTYDQDGNLIPLSQRFDTESEDIRYRIGTEVVEMGDNTLVGLHNISTAKLRKAIKQGGLANPSVAVINMAIQDHEQYGDITLVMPSSMIDSTTGRNAGTYTGDIWSPTYPYVERKMSDKGSDKYYDALNKAFEGKHSGVKSRTAVIFVNMLDNQGNPDNLAYWYMLEKGIAPTDVIINSGISDDIKQRFEPLIDKRFAGDLTSEERELLLGIAAELEGKTTEELLQAAQEAKKRYEDTVLANEKASQFSKNIALSAIDEIDTYGVRFNVLDDTMRRVREAINKDGGVDVNATISAAVDYVQENGLKDDFDAWLDNLDDRFDIEEVIFDGYTRDGDRKYVKNTIANASRLMNQQPIQNATSHGGLSATRGQLVERMSTLAQIRANKHRLAAINEYEDEQWKAMQDEWFNEIINPLSEMQKIDDNTFINMDIAEQRLLEAIMEKDPIAYLNREYRYKIEKDSKFAKALKDLMGRLKALPSKYFETKFKRPVMLNEFVSAVVPQDLPQDLKDSLKEAGLDVYEYNDTEGSRREATIEATNGEGVRFRIGYEPMNDRSVTPDAAREMAEIKTNAERNGTYLKAPNGADTNLTPRQWLQVRTQAFKEWFGDWESKFRIAKLRDSKPIIATGNEYEGKYELNRDSAEKYILKFLRGAYVNKDTGSVINISRRGAEKVVRHDNDNDMHFKSIALIPQMIENAIYMGELPNEKGINGFDTYRYYVVGLNINGEDYTAKLVIGYIGRENYYDHALTQIEKGKLLNDIDLVKARFDTKEFDFERKDTKLFQILQINLEKSENFSQIVDENGEPMVVYHGTPRYSRKRFFAFNTNNGAAWFTPAKRYAEVFAKSDQDAISTLYETYISMLNPANVGNIDMEVTTDRLNTLAYGLSIPLTELEECVSKVEDVTYLWNLTQSKPFADLLKKYGYDGIQAKEAGVNSYGVFTPNQIKSATDNVGTFDNSSDDIRFRISNDNQRVFISNAEKAVEQIKQDKATPQQWKAMIEKQGGLKAGEDKWLGLSEWLDAQDKKTITKQEVLDFIAENQIQIEEVAYVEGSPYEDESGLTMEQESNFASFAVEFGNLVDDESLSPDDAYQEMIDKYGDDFEMAFELEDDRIYPARDAYGGLTEAAKYFLGEDSKTIHGTRLQYTTKGLKNNREIALTVPTIESWNENDEIHFGDAGEGRAIAWVRFGETTIVSKPEELIHAEKEYKDFSLKMMKQYGFTYTESVMSDSELQQERELLAKFRQAQKEYPKVESKVLVIDEIQSKRHQEGREKGYSDDYSKAEKEFNKASNEYDNFIRRMIDKYGVHMPSELRNAMSERELGIKDELDEAQQNARIAFRQSKKGIPSAPFEKNWHELAFKRILRYAAENGFDKVAWTTGAQQAGRYDIGESVSNIIKKDEYEFKVIYKNGNTITLEFDEDGVYRDEYDRELDGKSMSDIFGKETAKKLQELPIDADLYEEGLHIGGEGMKGFYDKMLPSFVSKYVKKWGAKVGEVTMPQLQEGYQTMHSVDITPEMRESVMEGQTMFRISSDKNDVQNVATEIWNKYQYDGELESMRDVAEYAEEHMPKNAQTQALFDAIDAYRIEAEEDRMYYGMRGDLEPFEDAIMDEVERLMNATTLNKLTESEQLTFDALQEVAADAGLDVVEVSEEEALEALQYSEISAEIEDIKANAERNGTYLKAPNGEDTKLTPRQWLQVRTRAFKEWFGDWENDADNASKIVDENGEPMVVYHGTINKFNAFETSSHGMHFGTIKSAQERLADKRIELRSSAKGNILGVFLNIRNPEETLDQDASWGYEVKYAKLRGADGLTYTNRWEDKGSTSYVTFSPNQIKSATNNVGTFDKNSDNIELFTNPINGTILGYAQGNRIVLTREGMNPETMVHEYTHIWAKAMQRKNRAGWENIKQIFRESPLWNDVVNDPNYQGLKTDDAICSEVLARYSGKYGAERLDEVAREMILEEQQSGSNLGAARVRALINRARTAIKSFWKWVGKDLFGITKFDSQEDVADRVLYDLLNATDLDAQNNEGAAEKSMERPSPEFVEAMRAWNAANPYPVFGEDGINDIAEFRRRLNAWNEARDAYRRHLYEKATEEIETADPIVEPLTTEKPIRRKDETAKEYAQRLKLWQDSMIDSKLQEEYTAEMNRLASTANQAKRAFIDAAQPIEEWQNWLVQRGAKINGDSNAYQDMFLAQGRVTDAADDMRRNIIQPLASKIGEIIDSKKLDSLELRWSNMDVPGTGRKIDGERLTPREIIGVYCQAKDCEEAEEKGLPDRGKDGFINNLGVSYDTIVSEVESRLSAAEVAELWDLIRKATKYALEYDYKSGRISEDTYNEFQNREYYVPQRGWRERDESGLIEEYEPVGKRGHDPYNAALVKARGRKTLAADPFAYIMSIDHSSIVSSENNKIKQKMLEFCLENEELGLTTGAFRVKKYWLMHEIDPDTGKILKDEDGAPIVNISYTEPSAEEKKKDNQTKEQIKRIQKDIAKNKRQIEAGVGPKLETALKAMIDRWEKQVAELEDTLLIAWGATNTHISQRTRDEKMQHEVQVMKDGQRYVIELQDEKVANAINKRFKEHQQALFSVSDKIRNATRFMSAMLTQYNPEFAFSNFVRDYQVALATLLAENPKLAPAFVANFAMCQRAVWAYAFNDRVLDRKKFVESDMGRYLQEYMASGAPTGFSYMQDLKSLRQDFDKMVNQGNVKRGIRAAAGMFALMTEWSETAVRFSAYVSARKAGWSVNDAAYMSKELTTNFDRAGEKADSGWMAWFSFFRATINGNIKFFRAIKKFPIPYSIIAAVFFAAGIANQLMNPNDPEDEVWASDYVRENNFVIGKWRIPAAHFMRIFFSAGVNMASWMQGERTFGHAVYNSAMSASNEILPNYMNVPGIIWEWSDEMQRPVKKEPYMVLRELAPTPVSPIADVWLNRNFMGGKIIREPFARNQNNVKNIAMTRDNTLPIYRAITEEIYTAVGGDLNFKYKSDDNAWTALFDISGSQLEHVVEGYAPAAMDMLATTANMIYDAVQGNELTPDKLAFIRKFYNTYSNETAYNQLYWSLYKPLKEYDKLVKEYKDGNPKKYAKETQSDTYRIYKYAKNSKLLKEPKENPTLEDVKQLYELHKQWVQARK